MCQQVLDWRLTPFRWRQSRSKCSVQGRGAKWAGIRRNFKFPPILFHVSSPDVQDTILDTKSWTEDLFPRLQQMEIIKFQFNAHHPIKTVEHSIIHVHGSAHMRTPTLTMVRS